MKIRLISDLSPPIQMNNILNRKGYGNPRAYGLSVVFFACWIYLIVPFP